jgi:hypothetical protein
MYLSKGKSWYSNNGRRSAVNTTLDGSTYTGLKLAPSSLCKKKKLLLRNEATYTWDW